MRGVAGSGGIGGDLVSYTYVGTTENGRSGPTRDYRPARRYTGRPGFSFKETRCKGNGIG
jgi:hypothetical protein